MMRRVVKIEGLHTIHAIVETTRIVEATGPLPRSRPAVRLLLESHERWETQAHVIDPDGADQLAASLQAAAMEIRLERGDEAS